MEFAAPRCQDPPPETRLPPTGFLGCLDQDLGGDSAFNEDTATTANRHRNGVYRRR
jgi:hypothetical protein